MFHLSRKWRDDLEIQIHNSDFNYVFRIGISSIFFIRFEIVILIPTRIFFHAEIAIRDKWHRL